MEKMKNLTTILTAFLAFMSALSTLMLTRSLNRVVVLKNEEVILQTQIIDQ